MRFPLGRESRADWFALHRNEHPEVHVPNERVQTLAWSAFAAALFCFIGANLGVAIITIPGAAATLCVLVVLWFLGEFTPDFVSDEHWQDLLLVVLCVISVACVHPMAWLLPLVQMAAAIGFCLFVDSILKNYIEWFTADCGDFEQRYFRETFHARHAGGLQADDRDMLLSLTDTSTRTGRIKIRCVARSTSTLEHANSKYRGAIWAFCVSLPLTHLLAVCCLRCFERPPYWAAQFVFGAAWVTTLGVTQIACFDEFKFNLQRKQDREVSIRLWFSAANDRRRVVLSVALLVLLTAGIVRPAAYFPVLPVSRLGIAKQYLASRERPHAERDARRFLNDRPENWIVVSLEAVCKRDPNALWYFVSLCLSCCFCVVVPLFVLECFSRVLVGPVAADYSHAISLSEMEIEKKILRELEPFDIPSN